MGAASSVITRSDDAAVICTCSGACSGLELSATSTKACPYALQPGQRPSRQVEPHGRDHCAEGRTRGGDQSHVQEQGGVGDAHYKHQPRVRRLKVLVLVSGSVA